jgi:hypothetical protein
MWHPNCIPGDMLVRAVGIKKAFRFWYSGDVCRIVLAGGGTISIGPNHPVFTDRGWIPAFFIQKGDKLLHTGFGNWMPLDNPDVNDLPATAQDLFMTLAATPGMVAVQMPVAAEHFHGDGCGGDGNVEIVEVASGLRVGCESGALQVIQDGDFMDGNGELSMSGLRPCLQFLYRARSALSGFVSGCEGSSFLLRGGIAPPPGSVVGVASNCDSGGFDCVGDFGSVDSSLLGDSEDAIPGAVKVDEVFSVHVHSFNGWMYDFETEPGAYWAGQTPENMYILSNCDCQLARADEDVHMAKIDANAEAKNTDWKDLDKLAKYREEAGEGPATPPKDDE